MTVAERSPLVSVVVTCYNLGAYLDEAIRSVLAQTVQDFEILVVDDGSTDTATQALLAGGAWPRTTVFRTENQGLARARNFLIERARGTYLCALDADDRLLPEYFARGLAAFVRDPDIAFVSSWVRMFGIDDQIWRQDICDLPTLLAEDTVMTAALVRRDVVVALGGYDEHMPAPGDEDWDLWIRVVAAGWPGTILPEVLFEYRRRPDSMSTTCTSPPVHRLLVEYLMNKHRDLYAAHWPFVALHKDIEAASILRVNRMIERDIADRLIPDLRRAAAEKRRLQEKRDAHTAADAREHAKEEEAVAVRAELTRVEAEVRALRTSWSWRVTRPLRRLYDIWSSRSKDRR